MPLVHKIILFLLSYLHVTFHSFLCIDLFLFLFIIIILIDILIIFISNQLCNHNYTSKICLILTLL